MWSLRRFALINTVISCLSGDMVSLSLFCFEFVYINRICEEQFCSLKVHKAAVWKCTCPKQSDIFDQLESLQASVENFFSVKKWKHKCALAEGTTVPKQITTTHSKWCWSFRKGDKIRRRQGLIAFWYGWYKAAQGNTSCQFLFH